MKHKHAYIDAIERESIMASNADLILIEEQNITEGNFLVFADAETLQEINSKQDLNTRVYDISTYLSSSDATTIADIENSILEIELNKTINGGM